MSRNRYYFYRESIAENPVTIIMKSFRSFLEKKKKESKYSHSPGLLTTNDLCEIRRIQNVITHTHTHVHTHMRKLTRSYLCIETVKCTDVCVRVEGKEHGFF